ncbi:pre-RNA processing PIH1/Nop17-domain-containing protein [Chytriomyces sp. MP71]|nr:pre-RNA processing PIH1/Nop17-domain-containing protein [Chytriomyces sp. MP71]
MATAAGPDESKYGEKVTATKEELEKFANAMKHKEFRDLFHEYMQEISDPANRALYEREIEALENDRGNSIRWVKPTPGRVLKTRFTDKPAKLASELKDVDKVFVNLCTSTEIEDASMGGVETRGEQNGQSWSIPYSLDVGRMDVDKSNQRCYVYDCVFSPKTFEMGCKMNKFMDLLVTTALEGVEKRFDVKLDRDCKSLKMKYKGEIKATVIRSKAETPLDNNAAERKTSLNYIEKLANQQLKTQTVESSKPATRPPPPSRTIITGNRYKAMEQVLTATPLAAAEANDNASSRPLIQEIASTPTSVPAPTAPTDSKPETPSYTLTHRASLSYTSYMSTRNRSDANPPRPESLLLKIPLPKCSNASSVSLDVLREGWAVVVHAAFVGGGYQLALDLPFEVREERGRATFDKAERVLTVELPCVPAPAEVIPESNAPMEADEPESLVCNERESSDAAEAICEDKVAIQALETSTRSTSDKSERFAPTELDTASSTSIRRQDVAILATAPFVSQANDGIATTESLQEKVFEQQGYPIEMLSKEKLTEKKALDPLEDGQTVENPQCEGFRIEASNVKDNPPLELASSFIPETSQSEGTGNIDNDEVADDFHAALTSLTPCVPTQNEIEQLAQAGIKTGALLDSSKIWNLEPRAVDEVFGENKTDGGDDVIPTTAMPQSSVGEDNKARVSSKVQLRSNLIFALDD